MKPNNCALFVSTAKKDIESASTMVKLASGITIHRSDKWSDRKYILQLVEVCGVHDDLADQIKIGDTAIVHQHVTDETPVRRKFSQLIDEDEEGNQIRFVLAPQYFGKYTKEKIYPPINKIFCDYTEPPIVEKIGLIFIPGMTQGQKKDAHIETTAQFIHPQTSEQTGLKEGDKILVEEYAAYDIELEGKKYYMVDVLGLICKINGDKLSLNTIGILPKFEVVF